MPTQTYNRQESVWEACLAVHGHADYRLDARRREEGDIVGIVKRGRGGLGRQTLGSTLLVPLHGLDDSAMGRLTEPDEDDEANQWAKFRYCVPLARLHEIRPEVSLARIRDPAQCYHPFQPVHEARPVSFTEINVHTFDLPGRAAKGWVRLGTGGVLVCPEPHDDCYQVTLAIHDPLDATWTWPWRTWHGRSQDELKALFHTDNMRTIRQIIRKENWEARFGPMVHFTDPRGNSIDCRISYTVTAIQHGLGAPIGSMPPLDVHGLVFDKRTRTYL